MTQISCLILLQSPSIFHLSFHKIFQIDLIYTFYLTLGINEMDTFVLDVQNKSVHFLYNDFLVLFYKTKEKEKEFLQ